MCVLFVFREQQKNDTHDKFIHEYFKRHIDTRHLGVQCTVLMPIKYRIYSIVKNPNDKYLNKLPAKWEFQGIERARGQENGVARGEPTHKKMTKKLVKLKSSAEEPIDHKIFSQEPSHSG